MQTVEQYRVLNLVLEGTSEGNPYVDITLTAQFERADGTDTVEVRGFYRGAGRYGIRFMPRSAGTWTYRTSSNDPALAGITGEVEVTPASEGNHGRVLLTKDVKRSDVPFERVDQSGAGVPGRDGRDPRGGTLQQDPHVHLPQVLRLQPR